MKTKSHSQRKNRGDDTSMFLKASIQKPSDELSNPKEVICKPQSLSSDISKEQELRLCCQCEARGCMYGYEQSRKDAIEEVNKIIDFEIKDEEEAEQRRNTRYWTYQQELRYLKDKIKKELQ
jgi:hypothetical protein